MATKKSLYKCPACNDSKFLVTGCQMCKGRGWLDIEPFKNEPIVFAVVAWQAALVYLGAVVVAALVIDAFEVWRIPQMICQVLR